MRLIDADALTKRIHSAMYPSDMTTTLAVNMMEAFLKDEPTVEFAKDINVSTNSWISVKDKLPTSVANKVLVWLEHEDLNGYLGFGHYEKYKGQEIWYDLEHNEAFSIRGYAVTHWMPLPEPPEVNEND